MVAAFYRAFEDRHRGSRDLILARLKVYLPFLEPFAQFDADPLVIDLGCGRGEWLETVINAGFAAAGVDLDDGMLEGCRVRGLPAERDDAVGALKKRADNSVSVISAFHLVEHIPFPALQDLVKESLRVLKPGGLLILETPNAENLFVGTNGFYMDPTHERPIPHLLLSFLTEFSGFDRSKLLRLQEQAELHDPTHAVDLITALGSSSPDYAIIAQKSADEPVKALFDQPFAQTYGITPGELAARYDQGIDFRFQSLGTKMDEVSSTANEFIETLAEVRKELSAAKDRNGSLEHHNGYLESQNEVLERQNESLEQQKNKLEEQKKSLEEQNGILFSKNETLEQQHFSLVVDNRTLTAALADAEASVQEFQAQLNIVEADRNNLAKTLNSVFQSTSWSITHPLRQISSAVKGGRVRTERASLKRKSALRAIQFISTRPQLKRLALMGLKLFPASVKTRLWTLSVISEAPVHVTPARSPELPTLSLREGEIYSELKQALERKESK